MHPALVRSPPANLFNRSSTQLDARHRGRSGTAPSAASSPPLPLDHIGNEPSAPAPLRPTAPHADPPDALRPPGPNEHALGILSGQVHLLLGHVRDAPCGFGKTLEALALDPRQPLSRKQGGALLRAIKRLPAGTHVPPRQRMLRSALYELTRAARAEAMLHEQIARHTERERGNALPGSQRSVATVGRVGVSAGVTGAIDLAITVGGTHEHSTSTFDDMTVAIIDSAGASAEVSAQAGVTEDIGAHVSINGSASNGNVTIDRSMRDHVLRLAHASVERRLGGNLLQRAFKRVLRPRRDRYGERTSLAMAWQPKLKLLVEPQPVSQPLAFGTRVNPITATITNRHAVLSAGARFWRGSVTFSGGLDDTKLLADLPTRLTVVNEDGQSAAADPAVREALNARVSRLLANAQTSRCPALQQVRRALAGPGDRDDLATRLDAVAHIHAAFDHLQALADLSLHKPAQASTPLASLARDWGSIGTAREPVMIAMLDTLAWLQAVPPPEGNASAQQADWARLQRTVETEAARIHETTMAHDRERVYGATHAFREQTQRILSRYVTLSLGASLPLQLGGSVSLACRDRDDPDPLREGETMEVLVNANAELSLDDMLDRIEQQLPEWAGLPRSEAKAAIAPVLADLELGASAQLVIRFFRPRFQSDPDFPAAARGIHLHTVRALTGSEKTLGATLPVPFLPGAATTLSVHQHHSTYRTRGDGLGPNTITALLMRYLSLRSPAESPAATWAALVASHGRCLDLLAKKLTDPDSVPAQEVRYWLQRAPATTIGAAPTRRVDADLSTLDAFGQPADRATRRLQLHALFEAVGAITSRQKAMSPLIGPLTLRAKG